MAQAAPQAGGAAGKQFSDQEMQKWLTDNSFTQEQIVKVLILGNSGSGKSFLCNALLGYNTFEHKYQASSCTADNTFAAAVMGDMAFVVCNIPGLIEADERNIPRNEAAIKAAFAYLPAAPTLAAFVLSNAGGRPADQDYMAIRSVMKYVNMETASTSMIANNVDWDEIDQTPEEYRADVIRQSQSIIGRPGMEMEFVSRMPRATRTNYESPEMQHLCGQLVALFKRMQPAIMQPEEGAELALKPHLTVVEALREARAELHRTERALVSATRAGELRNVHVSHLQAESEKQQKLVSHLKTENNQQRATIEALCNRLAQAEAYLGLGTAPLPAVVDLVSQAGSQYQPSLLRTSTGSNSSDLESDSTATGITSNPPSESTWAASELNCTRKMRDPTTDDV